MEEITLNGFEVFEDFLPGANVPKKETQQTEQEEEVINPDIDAAGEELTDEELEALRNPKKTKKMIIRLKRMKRRTRLLKRRPGRIKKLKR